MQGVLEALDRELDRREGADRLDWSIEPFVGMLDHARQLTKEADEFLKKATKEKENGSKKVRKVKWVLFAQSDAKSLAVKFHEFYGLLCAVQSAVQIHLS